MSLTLEEIELIEELKKRDFDKDDKIGIALIARKYNIAKKILIWLKKQPKIESCDVFDFMYSLI